MWKDFEAIFLFLVYTTMSEDGGGGRSKFSCLRTLHFSRELV